MSASITIVLFWSSLIPYLQPVADGGRASRPRNSGPETITETTEPYPARVVQQKLNTPGIERVWLLFRPAPQLFGWRPGYWRRLRPSPLQLIQLVVDAFDGPNRSEWFFRVRLEKFGDKYLIDNTDATYSDQSSNASLTLWHACCLRWQSQTRFEYKLPDKGKTRVYSERCVLSGKTKEYPCAESVLPFEIAGEDWARLELVVGSNVVVLTEAGVKPFRHRGTITLRLCPTQNRYYAKIHYLGRDIGPGWRDAAATAREGELEGRLHRPAFYQEYRIGWYKLAQPD